VYEHDPQRAIVLEDVRIASGRNFQIASVLHRVRTGQQMLLPESAYSQRCLDTPVDATS
jgi:hypothetical protein